MKMVQSQARVLDLGLLHIMSIITRLSVSTIVPIGVQCSVITQFKLEELRSIIGSQQDS